MGKRPTPAPGPPPYQPPSPQPEHTELMQRNIHPAANRATDGADQGAEGGPPVQGEAASTTSRLEADSLALAVSHQIQLIHDAAGSLGGGPAATVTAFCDVAAHLLAMMYPTGIVPDTCKRGRKRAICSANYLVDALSSFTHHLHGGGTRLTREEWQQDISYLIRILEEGAVQLHEPMASTVSMQQLQWGTRCLQRAIMLLTAALDSSLRGECCWNTPKLWGELKDLVTPAAVLLEQRGDAAEGETRQCTRSSGSADRGEPVHPADVLQLAQGGQEGDRRSSTASSAATLLFEAAGEFRRLMPTLADEQVPLAMQLLHAAEATQQALFGGVMAADEETQTDVGEPCHSLPTAEQPRNPQPEAEEQAAVTSAGGREQQGQWIGLVGATESQAQAQLTGSLEEVIHQVAAQTQLDQVDDSHGLGDVPDHQEEGDDGEENTNQAASLATTMPWHAWSQPLFDGGRDRGTSSSEGESDVSQPSHRRRRGHALGL